MRQLLGGLPVLLPLKALAMTQMRPPHRAIRLPLPLPMAILPL